MKPETGNPLRFKAQRARAIYQMFYTARFLLQINFFLIFFILGDLIFLAANYSVVYLSLGGNSPGR